jgi:hypothetical protein
MPEYLQAMNDPTIIEGDVHVSLDYFLAIEAELNSCNLHVLPRCKL